MEKSEIIKYVEDHDGFVNDENDEGETLKQSTLGETLKQLEKQNKLF